MLISLNENKALFREKNIPIILCMKGIEIKTGFTPTKIVKDILGENYSCGAWIGPGHQAQASSQGFPPDRTPIRSVHAHPGPAPARNRRHLRRMRRVLTEFVIDGVPTTIDFHLAISAPDNRCHTGRQ